MKWDAFLPHVFPSTPGCPDGLAIDHIIKAARLFCARTLIWNYECTPILSSAGLSKYTLQIGDQEDLVRVLHCEVDTTKYEVPTGFNGRAAKRRGDGGNLCVMSGAHDFDLVPAPQVADMAIVLDVAVKPKLTSEDWPDDFGDQVTDIVHGALATLCALPNTAWRDPAYAEDQAGRFERRITVVGAKIEKGLGRSKQRATMEFF